MREGPVTLTAAKTTHAAAGAKLTWRPVEVTAVGAIRMDLVSAASAAMDDAWALLAYIEIRENGVTRGQIHKDPPSALGRARALAALDLLRVQGKVVVLREERGRNKQTTEVFYVRRPGGG
jgi:hypothetical protein